MDLNGKHYRENSDIQFGNAQGLLASLTLKGNETIFDLGCGDGRITAELARKVPRGKVIGIDPSESMIQIANDSFDLPNLEFSLGKAEELKRSEQADIVLILSALHWVKDLQSAFSKIFAHLKPDGKLYILTYPKESIFWEALDELVETRWAPYKEQCTKKTIFTSDHYLKELKQSGFCVKEERRQERMSFFKEE